MEIIHLKSLQARSQSSQRFYTAKCSNRATWRYIRWKSFRSKWHTNRTVKNWRWWSQQDHNKVTRIMSRYLENHDMVQIMQKIRLIPTVKTGNPTECTNYKTIVLIPHINKVLLCENQFSPWWERAFFLLLPSKEGWTVFIVTLAAHWQSFIKCIPLQLFTHLTSNQ